METDVQLLEAMMLLCFGGSWPFAIFNSLRTKSVEGKSIAFLGLVLIGYIAGIGAKIIGSGGMVIWFYAINTSMVLVEIALYLKHTRGNRARLLPWRRAVGAQALSTLMDP